MIALRAVRVNLRKGQSVSSLFVVLALLLALVGAIGPSTASEAQRPLVVTGIATAGYGSAELVGPLVDGSGSGR